MEMSIAWTRDEVESWIDKEIRREWKHGQIFLTRLGEIPDRTIWTIDGFVEITEKEAREIHTKQQNQYARFLITKDIFGEKSYSLWEDAGERTLSKEEFEIRYSFFQSHGGYTFLAFFANPDNTIARVWTNGWLSGSSVTYRMSRTRSGKPKVVLVSAMVS